MHMSQTTCLCLRRLAGHPSDVRHVGHLLLGPAVIGIGRSMAGDARWAGGLGRLAVLSGVLMLVGLVALPAIALGFDDVDTAPAWTWIAFVGWIGGYFLYPAWLIWFGQRAGRQAAGG